MRAAAILITAVVLCAAARPARADYEETEKRLKAIDIDAELRDRIHKAIRKSSDWLIETQRADGSWFDSGLLVMSEPRSGLTALCALALEHSGTPGSREASQRGIDFLVPKGEKVKSSLLKHVYHGGIAAMLMSTRREYRDIARKIAGRMERGMDPPTGWWSYINSPGTGANLSTTQFAALGLWAGDRVGAQVDRRVWTKHLRSLSMFQLETGGWGYSPSPNDRAYSTATYMGFANLALARGALGDVMDDTRGLRKAADETLERGLLALHRDGRRTIEFTRGERLGPYPSYYEIYALEKACIFGGLETLDGLPWYRSIAEVLVDVQHADGGFGAGPSITGQTPGTRSISSEKVDTAFALLFLLRTSQVYRPTTPSTPHSKRGPITPSSGDVAVAPPPEPEEREPPAVQTFVTRASRLLDEFKSQLDDRSTPLELLVITAREVSEAFTTLAPDPYPPPDEDNDDPPDSGALLAHEERMMRAEAAFKNRAEALMLRALVVKRVDRKERNRWSALNVEAANALATMRRTVSPAMRRVIAEHLLRPKRYVVELDVYRAAFNALATLDDPDSFVWLMEEVVDTDRRPDRARRCSAALDALQVFERARGKDRFEAARQLVRHFAPIEERLAGEATPSQDKVERQREKEYWELIGPSVVRAIRSICRDPSTGVVPGAPFGPWEGRVAHFRRWLEDHEDLRRSPWR